MLRTFLEKFTLRRVTHSKNILAGLIVVVGVGAVGLFELTASHAATTAVSAEAENGTVSAAASQVSDSSASGGGAVKFGSAGQSGCTPLSDIPVDYPNNCTTGYKAAPDYPGSLTPFTGTIKSNTTYKFMDFQGASVGTGSTPVTNVTFYGCRFHKTNVDNALVGLFGDNITFDYSTFEPDATFQHNTAVAHNLSYQYGIEANGAYGSHVAQLTVSHSDFWGFGNAIDTHNSTQAKPQVFEDNWIHDPANDGGGDYHTDGIGDESGHGAGSYVVINHNTILSPGNTNGIAFQQGTYDHFTITNNLLGGYNMMVAIIGGSYITFTDNTYDTLYQPVFGPTYPSNFWNGTGDLWRRNKWLVPSGAAWGTPANSGKYWLPCTYTIDSQVRDDWYTSDTDYDGSTLPPACH